MEKLFFFPLQCATVSAETRNCQRTVTEWPGLHCHPPPPREQSERGGGKNRRARRRENCCEMLSQLCYTHGLAAVVATCTRSRESKLQQRWGRSSQSSTPLLSEELLAISCWGRESSSLRVWPLIPSWIVPHPCTYG